MQVIFLLHTGKVSYFTATFPYVVMTILVVKGALLDGAGDGVSYYLRGDGGFDAKKMLEPALWKDAVNTLFFVCCCCEHFKDLIIKQFKTNI